MDWSCFGMGRRGFRPAVDTASYFPAASHEAASAAVAAALAAREPAALIHGPAGVGKSLVARRWLEQLPAEVPRVVLPNVPAAEPAELHQAILFDLSRPYRGLTGQELRLAVTAELLDASASGHPTVLLIDEAQHLGPDALEELRLLGNIETRGGSAVFVLLVGLPTLAEALTRRGCESFAQRVTVRTRVEPFPAEDSVAYLRHQVRCAGGDPDRVFEDDAVPLLAGACGGVARLLNHAAGLALDLAAEAGAGAVDAEAALEALARLGLAPPEEPGEPAVIPHPGRPAEPAELASPGVAAGGGPAEGDGPPAVRGPKQKAARRRSA